MDGDPLAIGNFLREIADKIGSRTADKIDAHHLRELARMFDGTHPDFAFKAARPPHRPGLGAYGVERKFEMAKAIDRYKIDHNCTYKDAFQARELLRQFGVGEDTLEKAWKEMRSVVRLSGVDQQFALFFKKAQALQAAKVRQKGGKKGG